MKNKSIILAAAVLFLLPSAVSLAADDADISGSLELGGRIIDDQDNSARFQEYRDLDSWFVGNLSLNYYKDSYFLDIEGENIGQDDQSYLLDGGSYGQFKYSVFYDEIPHNLSFDARSFYSGIGSNNLTIDSISPHNLGSWQTFDYTVDRKKYGGDIEVSLDSPFFINIGVNSEEKEGLKPLGSGSFSGQVELPEPVDYKTDNFNIAGGYMSDALLFKISGMASSFDNNNKYLRWTNPFLGINEVNSLPPNNEYAKIAANVSWRKLPMMSTFLFNFSYSNLSNDFSVDELNMGTPAGLNQRVFEGDISHTSLSASFVSRPTEQLDTRVFYDYFDRDNDSTAIYYAGGDNEDHLYNYTKNNLGLDADYKLSTKTKLGAGYEYVNIDRTNRPDSENNTDNLLYLKLKNTSLDNVTLKLEYTFLDRENDENFELDELTVYDAEYIAQYVKRFDNTSKQKNELKMVLEFYPIDSFDVGLEYTYAQNDYDDVTLGRTDDSGHEFYVDFMWRYAPMLTLSGFAGYETYQAGSNHYNYTAGVDGQTSNPTVEDGNAASYLWTQELDDNFWTIGLAAEMPLMDDRLNLSLSCQYQRSDGEVDFTPTSLDSIDKAEDYDIITVKAKALYAVSEKVDLIIGYLYEKAKYEDLQYLEYEYLASGSYLSGAYADYDYQEHVGYVTVKYHF